MTRIQLQEQMFTWEERTLVVHHDMTVTAFRYETDVAAIRISWAHGNMICLPFHGQQIWQLVVDDRDLTMKSIFPVPKPTRVYLENYGAFLLHCGITGMGGPLTEDTHPLHGELPNAPYYQAFLELDEDDTCGGIIGLGGSYEHRVAFTHHYLFEPLVKVYNNDTVLNVSSRLTNLMDREMDYMYLAHVNFRPVEEGLILCSAPCTPEATHVHMEVPPDFRSMVPESDFISFLHEVKKDPEKLTLLTKDLPLDRMVLLSLDYESDSDGWAHSLQIHPAGYADYIAHHVKELNSGVRWIVRNANEQALGLYLPGTAETFGYTREKEKGNVKQLQPGASVEFSLKAGHLNKSDTQRTKQLIESMFLSNQ